MEEIYTIHWSEKLKKYVEFNEKLYITQVAWNITTLADKKYILKNFKNIIIIVLHWD